MMPDYREIKSAESKFIIEYVFYAKKKPKYAKNMGKANKLCGC